MVKGHEFQRRNTAQGNSQNQTQKGQQEHAPNRDSGKNPHRENYPRRDFSNQNYQPKFSTRVKAEETFEDIKADIARIEKEIQLEIKEIKSMRLGL